ncbi:MAG: hypothetical protein P8X81_06040 [Woeseiaceae bacterium]
MDPRIIELINADIDGEISSDDKQELEALLAESPEAQAMHAELAGLGTSLNELPDLEPPAHLKHTIMASIPKSEAQQQRNNVIQAIFTSPPMRYAAMFALGSLVTMTLISSDQASNNAFNDVTGLVGTISSEVPVGPGIRSASIDRPEVAGHVTMRSSGPLLILDFDLVSSRPVDIVATYSDQTVWFNGFAQLESPGASISAESGRITMQVEGKRRYALFLHNAGERNVSINLEFQADGEVVYGTAVQFEQSGESGD